MTIVSHAVLVSMNARLVQFLKVTNILSIRMLVQSVVLALMFVLLKQSIWDNQSNRLYDKLTQSCFPQGGEAAFLLSADTGKGVECAEDMKVSDCFWNLLQMSFNKKGGIQPCL